MLPNLTHRAPPRCWRSSGWPSSAAFGRWLYAIGDNAEAARLAGIPVRRMRLAAFALHRRSARPSPG